VVSGGLGDPPALLVEEVFGLTGLPDASPKCSCFRRYNLRISSLTLVVIASVVILADAVAKGDRLSLVGGIVGDPMGIHLRLFVGLGLWSGSKSKLLFNVAQAIVTHQVRDQPLLMYSQNQRMKLKLYSPQNS